MEEGFGPDDLRAEYAAISAKLNQLPSFRFALAGFYVAGVGVLASIDHPTEVHFIMLFMITTALWIMDLRTRWLLDSIGQRGAEIEREYWGYDGWISRMRRMKPVDEEESGKSSEVGEGTVKWFFWGISLPRFATHSLGFDILFFVVLVFSVIQLFAVRS